MLAMGVLRSPHAHARIGARSFADAERLSGVVAVLAVEDVAPLGPLPVFIQPAGTRQTSFAILPSDKVLYVGQPVAAVVAETRDVAEDALDTMRVAYEPLPAVTDVDQAMNDGAPRLHETWPDNIAARREILGGDPTRSAGAMAGNAERALRQHRARAPAARAGARRVRRAWHFARPRRRDPRRRRRAPSHERPRADLHDRRPAAGAVRRSTLSRADRGRRHQQGAV